MIRTGDAMYLALREFADPACRRCRGQGYRKELSESSACACVKQRAPIMPGDMPHPWRAVIRRAQEMMAAENLGQTPDTWG